mgnify:CR=1 FL=1
MTTTNEYLLDELRQLNMSLDEFRIYETLDITLDDIKRLHKTSLWATIQKKLRDRQQQSNVRYLLGVLDRLCNEKMRPSPNDMATNPLAEYYNPKKSNKENAAAKRIAYNNALDAGAVAYIGFNEYEPLENFDFNDVEKTGGLWRVQHKIPYEITDVRDRQFVLVKKLPYAERTRFDFYAAASVVWGGAGASADIAHPSWIVARYETPRGTYMSYGQTIEQARAFLGIRLYDEYQDLIHNAAFEKQK